MNEVRTRFAPSPTGYLHLGGLRTALYTYLFARRNGGKFVLRIEDTDQEREVPGAVDLIYQSMHLAGLSYDEGPDVGGPYGPYIQSQRKEIYREYAWKLVELGAAYPCFCTKERLDEARKAAETRGETFKYDKHCLAIPLSEAKERIAAGEPYVIRQNVPTSGKCGFDDALFGHIEVDCATLDDNVLLKADGMPTYNFANVVDDHLMHITHVMRGTEYLSSAPKYDLLYDAFGWEKPVYVHLPVVMKDQTRKLSKRYGDPSFEDLLRQGYLRDAIINFIALLGWSPRNDREFFTLSELEEVFDLEGLNKSPAIFDVNKLTWMNGEYVRKLPFETYYELAMPWFEQAGVSGLDTRRLAELMQGRTEVFSQIPQMVRFLAEMPAFDNELYTHKKMKTDAEVAKKALTLVRPVLLGVTDWTEEALHSAVMAAIAESGMKNGQVLWPLRIAISGQANTPGGAFEIAYLLGKEETLRRLDASLAKL
ncbi:MAG TPA: glutamate--tRNA ligase [Candidatus Aphodomonas merdavium]|nr:glutamate--tRNA ligase [Candidatus Aphodomonas merdavium]